MRAVRACRAVVRSLVSKIPRLGRLMIVRRQAFQFFWRATGGELDELGIYDFCNQFLSLTTARSHTASVC